MSAPRRSARELLEQLARDEGLDDAWESESAAQRALLDLAAMPHAFNERMVREVLLSCAARIAPIEDVSFGWLVAHEDIEAVPGSIGIYRMRSRPRTERIDSWVRSLSSTDIFPTVPDDSGRADAFVDTSQQLADLLATWDERWDLERLYHLIAADPTAAVDAIAAAYTRADAQFDLVRCFEILTILDERDPLLTDVLIKQREDLRRYYDSRRRWTEAYTQSAFALEREFMRKAFDWTCVTVPEWIGVLEARGGMGKSMFVRWLIARKCVPEPARIPCARIDFDFPLPALLAEHPWLLIPQLVQQLEGQLRLEGEHGSTTELQRLAAQVQEQMEIALESQDAAQGSGRALTPERSRRFGAEMAERFGRALAERAQGPVLIVFDTIEEAFLRAEFYNTQGRNVIESALELLTTVHAVHPQLKVIFAGRFSPSGRDGTGDFATRYDGQWQRITLTPFSEAEAQEFLVRVRHAPDDARVASIIEKGGGLPLVLALWADIILARDEITASEIDASPEADLAYLIERVIDRLHDPRLQWVIRYGVIPRRLTRAFFDGVLIPAMREAMRGQAPHDIPARDRIPTVSGKPRFRTDLLGADQDLHPDELWDDLALYVSNSSFVYRFPDDTQAIAFHAEVVEPMRRLLRADQPDAFRALHMDAVRFHESRAAAATTAEARAAAMREAIYHLLQANPGTAGTRFEQWVDQARDSGDTLLGKVLVEELLSPEYANLDVAASPLAPALIGVAHVMRLETLAVEAREAIGSDRGPRWVELIHAVAEYRRFLVAHPAYAPMDGTLEIIEAEGTLNTQGAEAALPLFEAALERAQHDHRRLSASLGAADAADRLGQSERAARHAKDALALFARVAVSEQTLRRRQDLARVCEALGDYASVVSLLRGAASTFSSDPSAPMARLVEACLASGRAADALECAHANLNPPGAGTPDDTDLVDRAAQAQGLVAIAAMQHGDTKEALQLVRTTLLTMRTGLRQRRPDEPPERWERRAAAIASAASARIWEQHLDLADAVECVEQGQRDWAAVGNAEAAGDALRHRIELTLFEIGDRQLAASLIGESLYLTLAPESEVSGRLLVLRTLFQRPGVTPAVSALRALLEHVAVRRWRSVRLLVLSAIIDTSDDEDTEVVKQFVSDLAAMTPVGARLEFLGALARFIDRPLDLAPWAANDIAHAAGVDDPSPSPDPVDAERAMLLKAQVEWLLGHGPQAARRLEDLLPHLTCQTLMPGALELARRLVAEGHAIAGAPWGGRYRRRDDASPTANGRIALALGELALRAGDLDAAAAGTAEAVADLGGESYPQTRWGAMAHAAAAGVARAKGDTAEWQEHAARADRTLESLGLPRLGDPASRVVIPKPMRPAGAASPTSNPAIMPTPIPAGRRQPNPGPEEPSTVVTLQTSWNDGLVVEMRLDGDVVAPAQAPLVAAAIGILGPGRDDEVVPFELVRRVADDWRGLSQELTAAVLGRPDIRDVLLAQGTPELRLVLDPPAVAALPVELLPAGPQGDVPLHATDQSRAVYRSALGGPNIVRWVQEALIENGFRVVADGIWGPQGRGALAAFQRRCNLPPTERLDRHTVLLLAEGLVQQRSHVPVALVTGLREGARRATRGTTGRASVKEHFDVTALYKIAGLSMEAPEKNLVTSLQARRPVILHLCGTFDESSSLGGVVMRFGTENMVLTSGAGVPGETPSTLGAALKLLPPVYRPIVVLDPFPATSHTEVVRQLLLRNVFAHELFRLGACPAIIGVGFEAPTPDRVPLAYSVMAEAWKDSLSVLDVLRRLRTAAGRERRTTSNLVELLGTSPADACVVYAGTPAHTLFARPRLPTSS